MHANNNIVRSGRSSFSLLLLFLCALLAGSCTTDGERNSTAYSLLVQADSAYMRGHYRLADSLLSCCDSIPFELPESFQVYKELLKAERLFVDDKLNESHFCMIDSLRHYYQKEGFEEAHSKTLLFLGDIYYTLGDYPSALDYFLKAEQLADSCEKPVLKGMALRLQGDVYFAQRVQDECIRCFRKSFDIAQVCRDTLRIAHAAMRLGLCYTYESNVDSALAAYQCVLDLGNTYQDVKYISPTAKWRMCDIYIQLEEYDDALKLMPRDSLNMDNWGYWHYGQHHTDSAIYYFTQVLPHKSLRGKSEILRLLVQLERERGNESKALDYSIWQSSIEDSIKATSQVEKTYKTQALHDISMVINERDQLASRHRILIIAFVFLLIAFIVSSLLLLSWRRKIQRAVLADEMAGYTDESRLSNDVPEPLRSSALYQRLREDAGSPKLSFTNEEMAQLVELVNLSYNNFVERLRMQARLNETDISICCLIKLGVASAHIAFLFNRSKGAITMRRQRLYKKILKKDGTPTQFNEFILKF